MSNGETGEKLAREIMARAGFLSYKIHRSIVWASKSSACPTCDAPAYSPCTSMVGSQLALPVEERKKNKNPHRDRTDWHKLVAELQRRGYH